MFRTSFDRTLCGNLLLAVLAINLSSLVVADLYNTRASSGKPQRWFALEKPMKAGLVAKARALGDR